MPRALTFALAAFLGLLALGLAVQVPSLLAEGSKAVDAALSSEAVRSALEAKVRPLVEEGRWVPLVVYVDPASPPEARTYVVEWLDPNTLYLTALVKVKVRVAGGEVEVLSVEAP
ncbi:hypothetical protein B6U99_06655 [Candidatus Geothermarchaeota archaeon ex4572_27]|nr:MAG: hypothetical protein B6U99_06655 [Candidatus Geothermarchaeota archaeon ex4572_27]